VIVTAKILIVEDDVSSRRSLSKCLEMDGFEILCCGSGEEAISVTLADYPDVILMDLGLPGMSGIEAAQAIKQNGAICNTPIIALSGRPAHLWEQAAIRAGMCHYLSKPASAAAIVQAIQQFLPALTRAAPTAENVTRGKL
jgi:CheY-like chemotaxis protein